MKNEARYRLRNGQKIVGYMRKLGENSFFYSKDAFWWTGSKITYKHVDEWTGLLDKNRTPVYEWDIVKCKIDPDGEYLDGAVLWENRSQQFGIQLINEDVFFPLFLDGIMMFNERQLQVFSFFFINPVLMDKFGLTE